MYMLICVCMLYTLSMMDVCACMCLKCTIINLECYFSKTYKININKFISVSSEKTCSFIFPFSGWSVMKENKELWTHKKRMEKNWAPSENLRAWLFSVILLSSFNTVYSILFLVLLRKFTYIFFLWTHSYWKLKIFRDIIFVIPLKLYVISKCNFFTLALG